MENRLNQDSLKPRDAEFRGIKMRRKPMFDESGTTLLNGVKLSFQKGFGFNQNSQLKNNAFCIDDNRIVYLLSSQIVIYDMLAQTQKVIDCFDADEDVGAMMYFKDIMLEDNLVYALHNCNKSFPSLTLMNFSKNFNQKIPLANLQKEERITDLALLNDFRNIATISRLDKLSRLTIIQIVTKDIKTSEYLNFNPIAMYSIAQHPTKLIFHTQTQIYINDIEDGFKMDALGVKKYFQFQNQNIVQIANSLHNQYCVYVITDQGNLYFTYVDMKEFKIIKAERYFLGNFTTLDEKGVEVIRRRKPSSLCANQYNVAIGYELIQQFTLVKICAISSQPPSFQAISFSCPFLHKIVKMNFAAETMAICVIVQVKQNDKYDFSIPIQSQYLKQKGDNKIVKQNLANHLLPAGKIFPIIFNLLLYDTLVQTLRSPVQAVLNSLLLTKKVLDICVLPTKKLILVLSGDKRIKAIKYEHVTSISFDRMLAWQMIFGVNDQPTSLDVHPLTFHVAVGMKDGVKLFNLFSDGMRTTNLFFMLKNCQCVRYSRFGHLLIAGSPNQIIVINPYQNIVKNTIQLSSGYNTRQLSFVDRDMYIFGSFMNGSSQILSLQGNKIFEVWNKSNRGYVYSCYDPVFDIMIVSYDDNVVKFYRERGQIQYAIMWTYPFLMTKILLVNELGTAFMGTSTGKIRVYQWPFTDMVKFNKSYTEIQLHRTAITQIKITHDFSFLITGSEDGTIFISKITPYSDGIAVSDSSILHSFKMNKKNYTSLYYLQNFMCTNSSIQNQREQDIMRYESDRTDSSSQFVQILKEEQRKKQQQYEQLEQKNKTELNAQIQPLEAQIEGINRNKIQIKQQLNILSANFAAECEKMQQKKLQKMKQLYKQSDELKCKLQQNKKKFQIQIAQKKQQYDQAFEKERNLKQQQQRNMINECVEKQKDFVTSLGNYKELMKLQDELGQAYKSKMMEELENQLKSDKQQSEKLRKQQNKISHSLRTQQQKTKYIQQLSTQIQIDLKNALIKREGLEKQKASLSQMLKDKDKQIFNEEKAVKQLLKKSINNYSHQQYLKHKQDQLIQKAKYLQKQIQSLDEKYKQFQQNFIQTSKQTNDFTLNIALASDRIKQLEQKQRNVKQKRYVRRYKDKQVYSKILQCFHQCNSKAVFAEKVKFILSIQDDVFKNAYKEEKIEVNVGKRDHLIDKVVNTNKLRKIDDTIRKTIMVKLNRETVNLISQVNQLRKEKKVLSVKIRDLKISIKEIRDQFQDKQNKDASLTDIVPVNISVIRSHNSKHTKPLPFQVYHQNKLLSQRSSTHSKVNSKSIMDEGSTQLPSIIKHSVSYAGGSILQESNLFGVDENEDEVAQ